MKKITFWLSLCLLGLFSACQADNSAADEDTTETMDLTSELPGTWQTIQINVALNTADGLDTFRTESLTEDLWRSTFQMEPPIYYFEPDNKYRRVHRNLNGDVIDEGRGMWTVFGDTLNLTEPDASYQYIVRAGQGRATFRTFLDWDEDGEADDEYQALQRKISIGVE